MTIFLKAAVMLATLLVVQARVTAASAAVRVMDIDSAADKDPEASRPPNTDVQVTPQPDSEAPGCHMVSACACETADGRRMDLSLFVVCSFAPPAGVRDPGSGSIRGQKIGPQFLDVKDTNSKDFVYSWNPCYDFTEGQCADVAMLQTDTATGLCYDLGRQMSVDFLVSSERGLLMTYSAKATEPQAALVLRTTYVQLQCDPEQEAQFTAGGETMENSGIYLFTLRSRHACLLGGRTTPTTTVTPPTTRPTPATPATPAVPTSDPEYNLKTVVDLMLVLAVLVAGGVVVMLMLLVAFLARRGVNKLTSKPQKVKSAASVQGLPDYSP